MGGYIMANERPFLLAEDSEDDQLLIVRSLKKCGITNRVVVANDGVEALDFLFGSDSREGELPLRPAVVLLDIKMPRIGGLEVLERIRASETTRHLPVVMLTSSDEEQDKARSYAVGANSYVRKPVDFEAYARAIANLGTYWIHVNEPPPVAAP
jgi:two-component system response regulator